MNTKNKQIAITSTIFGVSMAAMLTLSACGAGSSAEQEEETQSTQASTEVNIEQAELIELDVTEISENPVYEDKRAELDLSDIALYKDILSDPLAYNQSYQASLEYSTGIEGVNDLDGLDGYSWSLCDMNQDNVPELIICESVIPAYCGGTFVYTIRDSAVQQIGVGGMSGYKILTDGSIMTMLNQMGESVIILSVTADGTYQESESMRMELMGIDENDNEICNYYINGEPADQAAYEVKLAEYEAQAVPENEAKVWNEEDAATFIAIPDGELAEAAGEYIMILE